MMCVREKDTSFVDTFLTAAVGILRTKDCKDTATDRTSFSIVPKKVKIVCKYIFFNFTLSAHYKCVI